MSQVVVDVRVDARGRCFYIDEKRYPFPPDGDYLTLLTVFLATMHASATVHLSGDVNERDRQELGRALNAAPRYIVVLGPAPGIIEG